MSFQQASSAPLSSCLTLLFFPLPNSFILFIPFQKNIAWPGLPAFCASDSWGTRLFDIIWFIFGLLPAKFPHSFLPAFPLLYPVINILLHMLVLSTTPGVAKATKESTRGAIHVFLPKGWWLYSWLFLPMDSDNCFRWCSCMERTGEAALIKWHLYLVPLEHCKHFQWKKKMWLKN